MALSRHNSPVDDYGYVDDDEDWASDNGATTKSTLKDLWGDRSLVHDTDTTMVAETPVEVDHDATANTSTDATVGAGENDYGNGSNDAYKRTVAYSWSSPFLNIASEWYWNGGYPQ